MRGPQSEAQAPQPVPYWMQEQAAARRERDVQGRIYELMAGVPQDKTLEGLQMAIRLEGVLGLEADRQAGVPITDALTKWAPKIYFEHPQGMAQALRSVRPEGEEAFTPTIRPYINEKGERVGDWYQTSLHSGVFRPSRQELSWQDKNLIKELDNEIRTERTALTKRQEDLSFLDPVKKPIQFGSASNAVVQAQSRINALKGEKAKIMGGGAMTLPQRAAAAAPIAGRGLRLTIEKAREFMTEARGDKEKARKLAIQAGYSF